MSTLMMWWNNQSIVIKLLLGLFLGFIPFETVILVHKAQNVEQYILANYQRQAITLSFALDCIVLKDPELLFNLLARVGDSNIKEIIIDESHPSCVDRSAFLQRMKQEFSQNGPSQEKEIETVEDVEEMETVEDVEEMETVEDVEEIETVEDVEDVEEMENKESVMPSQEKPKIVLSTNLSDVQGELREYDLDLAGEKLHQIDYTVKVNGVTLTFGINDLYEQIRRTLFENLQPLLLSFVGNLFIALFVIIFIIRGITKPMKALAQWASQLAKGGVDQEDVDQELQIYLNRRDEVGTLAKDFKIMSESLKKLFSNLKLANEELQQYSNDLEKTLKELTLSQAQLVQSEKMAALGQLIAGITHEVNTPLGAIQASGNNIADALKNIYAYLPELLQELSHEELDLFFKMLSQSTEQQTHLTSREERKYRRLLTSELDEIQVENAGSAAAMLVSIGLYDNLTPYYSLLQNSQPHLLQTVYDLSSLQKSTGIIHIAVERATKVVFALKKFIHQDISGEMVSFDLHENIETVLILYQNQLKQGIEITKEFTRLPPIQGYPDELSQVWTNLLHNAIQAMKYKGHLQLETLRRENQVIVKFTDNGSGIPEDMKDRIFDPFFTTKSAGEGTGLGLGICKKIIEKHAGNIEVESVPGKTTFSITLPID